MSHAQFPRIHPTAIIAREAELADNVVVGPYAIIEGRCIIGPDCIIRPHAVLCGNLTMGRGNQVYSGAIIGEKPQHLKYNDEPTGTEIGDNNIFREHVTIHRGTTHSMVTRIGDNNFFMAGSHVAHDCEIGNRCILANGALVGGHSVLSDNVYLSGNAAVHQFVRIGRLALLSGCSGTTKDMPPFVIQQNIDTVVGINVIGMRRAGLANEQINVVHRSFRYLFRAGMTVPDALKRIEDEMGEWDVAREMVEFIRNCPKGINTMRRRRAA